MLVAGDVYRPAAIDQLVILGQQVLVLFIVNEALEVPIQGVDIIPITCHAYNLCDIHMDFTEP